MANRRLIRPLPLLTAVTALVAALLLAGCTAQYEGPLPGSPVVAPSSATVTVTATATPTAAVDVIRSTQCNNWTTNAASQVNGLRWIGDEVGFGLIQAGFLPVCEMVDDPEAPTALVQQWTDTKQRTITWVLSTDQRRAITAVGFVGTNGGTWVCPVSKPFDTPVDQLFGRAGDTPEALTATGCLQPGRN